MVTVLDAIATGNPPIRGTQRDGARFMQQINSLAPSIKSRIPQIYENSGIEYRYSCIDDYLKEPAAFSFYPPNAELQPAPSTSKRNKIYRRNIVPLAENVARKALSQAGVAPEEVTHLITVSCTGFFAPGLDIELTRCLDLRPEVSRTMIGFMGCYAAFNALRAADAFCRSHADARVLLVCAELCTIHFQIEDSLESAIINAIFSDGAAAAVLSSRREEDSGGKLVYGKGLTMLDEDSMDHMTWDIGDTGFMMGLSARVPEVLARNLPGFVEELLTLNEINRKNIQFWAIHPGGRLIVERAREALDLSEDDVSNSLEVLRLYGNMSSPTILFVLKRILDQIEARPTRMPAQSAAAAFAFGPGLTIEGCVFKLISSV